jgi:hypothetical protein
MKEMYKAFDVEKYAVEQQMGGSSESPEPCGQMKCV